LANLKIKLFAATILAVTVPLLMAEATFILFPSQEFSMPPPLPQANSASQLVWSLQWLGFAVLVSLLIVGAILLVKRLHQTKNDP
jgi:hypothetical protein